MAYGSCHYDDRVRDWVVLLFCVGNRLVTLPILMILFLPWCRSRRSGLLPARFLLVGYTKCSWTGWKMDVLINQKKCLCFSSWQQGTYWTANKSPKCRVSWDLINLMRLFLIIIQKRFPVLCRCDFVFLFEITNELSRIGVSDGVTNIIQFHICSLQKLLCPVQLKIPKNFGEGLLKVIPKKLT